MKKPQFPNNIAQLRKRIGMKQTTLAALIGAHPITVSKIERGQLGITGEWAQKIGEALRVDPLQLHPHLHRRRKIYIDGVVASDSSAVRYNLGDEPCIEVPEYVGDARPSLWYLILSDALEPTLHSGDLIRVSFIDPIDESLVLGRLCGVQMKDGEIFFGYVHHGSRTGRYSLARLNGPLIKDMPYKNVGLVTMAIFNPAENGALPEAPQ